MLSVGESVGLFELKLAEQREIRLFHRNGFNCLGFDYSARDKRLILARAHEDGTAHLEVYDDEGNCKGAVTGGDCVDAAPSFSPSEPSVAYYQSCGVARHPQRGHAVVVSFDIADDDSVIYSNGFELLRAAGSQPKATLGRADLVESVSLA